MGKTDNRGGGWRGGVMGGKDRRVGRLWDDLGQRVPPGPAQDKQQTGGRTRTGRRACSRTQPRSEDTDGKLSVAGGAVEYQPAVTRPSDSSPPVTLRRSQARANISGPNPRPCCGLRLFSRGPLFATPCTVAHQLLCLWDSRQEYWSGWRALLQGIFLTQGSNPGPALAGGFLTSSATWEAVCTDSSEQEQGHVVQSCPDRWEDSESKMVLVRKSGWRGL